MKNSTEMHAKCRLCGDMPPKKEQSWTVCQCGEISIYTHNGIIISSQSTQYENIIECDDQGNEVHDRKLTIDQPRKGKSELIDQMEEHMMQIIDGPPEMAFSAFTNADAAALMHHIINIFRLE
jgi:hypothetical protein